MVSAGAGAITLFVCGDVMTGRGIDQVLAHPSDPVLYEPFVRDARAYVRLAEDLNGPIPRPVDAAYIWGDALRVLRQAGPDVRLINLETSITTSAEAWPGKGIHYRMHPRNITCLTVAHIDCCSLANNHVLDWGHAGLLETLATLEAAGIAHAGAGRTAAEATAPAVLPVPGKGRVLVFAMGETDSGIPRAWAATARGPGVYLLDDLSDATAERVVRQVQAVKQIGDVVVASIHWGGNWGYEVPAEHVRFAHRLVEGGVDLVHGHSSHHVKGIEVYRDHLVLYGCGDFIDDYEGISGYEAYRDDLRVIYLVRVEPGQGRLEAARLVPFQARRFRLHRATSADARWLCDLLSRLGAPFGTGVQLQDDGSMLLTWQ